jgi:thioredoxin-dependent adenylylsulfate APS reductase
MLREQTPATVAVMPYEPPACADWHVAALAASFEHRTPQDLLTWAIRRFGAGLALVTSFQAEGMVLLDMAVRIDPAIAIVTVDTGRLPQETYDLMEQVRERYDVRIAVHHPEAETLDAFIGTYGVNAFYRSAALRLRCCDVRKVAPLQRALSGFEAWISGRRRGHAASRADMPKVELDESRGGLVKLNPLANWSEEQVWDYIRVHEVPHNALYDRGYTSIGCAPCTRAVQPGEDPRAGRWWWEENVPKECGMHCYVNLAQLSAEMKRRKEA